MRGILSKTRFNHGDLRYPYLALLNMLANVGSIQVDVLLKSLVKSEDLRSYSKLLKSMDVSFMEHLLASLTRNIRPNWVNNFKVAAR